MVYKELTIFLRSHSIFDSMCLFNMYYPGHLKLVGNVLPIRALTREGRFFLISGSLAFRLVINVLYVCFNMGLHGILFH